MHARMQKLAAEDAERACSLERSEEAVAQAVERVLVATGTSILEALDRLRLVLSAPEGTTKPWSVVFIACLVSVLRMWHPTNRNICGPAADCCARL
jgi:hypothetical protein